MFCHYAVVEEGNIDPLQRLDQFLGYGFVIWAGKRVATGVVMSNH